MYTLSVVGRSSRRDVVVGFIVTNSANMTQQFACTDKEVRFHFRYLSSARMMLRRVSRQFKMNDKGCDLSSMPEDVLLLKVSKTTRSS